MLTACYDRDLDANAKDIHWKYVHAQAIAKDILKIEWILLHPTKTLK